MDVPSLPLHSLCCISYTTISHRCLGYAVCSLLSHMVAMLYRSGCEATMADRSADGQERLNYFLRSCFLLRDHYLLSVCTILKIHQEPREVGMKFNDQPHMMKHHSWLMAWVDRLI